MTSGSDAVTHTHAVPDALGQMVQRHVKHSHALFCGDSQQKLAHPLVFLKG